MNQDPKHNLINDLGNLLQSQLLTDVTFKIGKNQLKAHRYILAGEIDND